MSDLEPVLENLPQLLGLGVAGVLNLQVASLGDNLLRGERPLGISPARVGPPALDLRDLLGEELVFHVWVDGGVDHVVGGHDCGCLLFTFPFVLARWIKAVLSRCESRDPAKEIHLDESRI